MEDRAHEVFKKGCPIFEDSCNLVRDWLDVKEVMGRTQSSEEVSKAEMDRGTSWELYLCCWS